MDELIPFEGVNAVTIYTEGGADVILKKIREEVTSQVNDVKTAKGRKNIASLAHKIARSKTKLDDLGKELKAEWLTKSNAVDAERRKVRDNLDALKEEIRQPLTDWEDAEKERVAGLETKIAAMATAGCTSAEGWMNINLDTLRDGLKTVEDVKIDDSWEEYANDAAKAKDAAVIQIKEAIAKREKHDAEQAELEKLRKESAEREQKELEDKLREEGEKKAQKEAEESRIAEAKRQEEKRKAEKERSEKAERDAIEAKEKAELEAKEAKESADRKAEEAAQAERDRIEQERIAEEQAAKKREADKIHRTKINNSAVEGLVMSADLSEKEAKAVVTAIAKGQIPYVAISY